MVQKKGKHGIRTGNTIRAIDKKILKRYRKDACIVRRDTTVQSKEHTGETLGVFEGADIPCEDVIFSLNKNGRWLLPELIKNAFEDELQPSIKYDNFGADSFQLVERHKLNRNNNCISIYAYHTSTTKDDKTVRIPTIKTDEKGGYIDADNVLKTPAMHSRHTNRLYFLRDFNELDDVIASSANETKGNPGDGNEVDFKVENETCERQNPPVRYEVFYPCEETNVLTLKSKHIGINTKKTFKCRNIIRRPWIQEGYKFRSSLQKDKREHIRNLIQEDLEDFRFEQDDGYSLSDYWFEKENYSSETETKRNVRSESPEVGVYQPETKLPGPSEISAKNVCSEIGNEADISVDKCTLGNKKVSPQVTPVPLETEEDLYIFPRKITKRPVCVLLRKIEIDIDALKNHHEDDYIECRCSPRRFVISISKYINDLDLDGIGSAYRLLRVLSKSMFAWLVFVHDPIHKLNSFTEDVYNVSLSANFNENISDIKIEGLVEGSVVTITDIIGQTLNYLKSLPRECMIFETKSHANKNVQVVNVRSLLEELQNWSFCSYLPDNSYVIKHLIQSTFLSVKEDHKNPTTVQGKSDKTEDIPCTICYRKDNTKLALLSCAHFFCNRCWEATIYSKVNEGSCVIFCPDRTCTDIVDTGTIISFLNVKDIQKFARLRHNTDVEQNRLARWCSNESCGRVVMVNRREAKITRCSCGESMCFRCSGKPHWPLSCKQHLEYIDILIETHDRNIIPHEFIIKFDSKYCRICLKIVSRHDKCSINRCPCGGVLCQRCSFLWHTRAMSIYQPQRSKTVASLKSVEINATGSNVENRTNIFSEGKRTRWYNLAMKHRLQQHPFRLAKIQANSKLLANRISHYILREEKKGHYVYLEFMLSDNSYLRESERVSHYMSHIVDIYKEISSIIENVAFFLNDDSYSNDINEWLHRRTMILSTCAKTIYDLLKDGAFLNPKVVIERLNDTYAEVRRVLESIIK